VPDVLEERCDAQDERGDAHGRPTHGTGLDDGTIPTDLVGDETRQPDGHDAPRERRGPDEAQDDGCNGARHGSVDRGDERDGDAQERREDDGALCDTDPCLARHEATSCHGAGWGLVAGTEKTAIHDAPAAWIRTVAVEMAVADPRASPQVTLKETRMPAGTDTTTVRTAPRCRVLEVTPPSNVPCCGGGLAGVVVVVVTTGSVVVVEEVVVVDVVVEAGESEEVVLVGVVLDGVVLEGDDAVTVASGSLEEGNVVEEEVVDEVDEVVVCAADPGPVEVGTNVVTVGVGAPATTTTASAARTTASAARPPVGSRRVRMRWRLRRCFNVRSRRCRKANAEFTRRCARRRRKLGRRVPEYAARVEEVHIGYAGGGRECELARER